jgi:hypothetical protein
MYLRMSLAAVVLIAGSVNVRAESDDERAKLDCGVNALFLLHRLEGRPVTVEQILSKLPAHNPEGYSMAELAAASEALGLGLEGVRFAEGDPNPDRTAIAFIRDARGGHFTVLRPVGNTGTMVQVIDPPAPPWIADYDRLFVNDAWTDRILIPRPPWYSPARATGRAATAGMAAVVAASLAALWMYRRAG